MVHEEGEREERERRKEEKERWSIIPRRLLSTKVCIPGRIAPD